MEEFLLSATPPPRFPWYRKLLVMLVAGIVLSIVIVGIFFGYTFVYRNVIFPGVYVADYQLGGLTQAEAVDFFENLNNRLLKEGIDFQLVDADGTTHSFVLPVTAGTDAAPFIEFKSNTTARSAWLVGRNGSPLEWWWQPLWLRIAPRHFAADVAIQPDLFDQALRDYVSQYAQTPREASLRITDIATGAYTIIPEQAGRVFHFDAIRNLLQAQLATLNFTPLTLVSTPVPPTVTERDVKSIAPRLPTVLRYGGIDIHFIDPETGRRTDWNIPLATLAGWIQVSKQNGTFFFSLDPAAVTAYLDTLRGTIEKPSTDARFVVTGGKVTEFQSSRNGLAIDLEKTYANMNAVFVERNYEPKEPAKTVEVVTKIVEPNVKMTDANNFGVQEIVGVGVSSFKGSHVNRIKNIAHAVQKLNGLLIPAGEEFSTNKSAGPFTAENGYFPELVIKGREIKPEVGGGMCQIGTTLFRMAMNTGLPIVERRNHSLVVNYYSDPVNNNPGTDATVYDPIVDFRFLNDTGSALLLQTEMDYVKTELRFTLWGTKDGRSGSYTHPIVKRWIAPSDPEEVMVDTLAPGEKKCQAPYRGAVATFTYSRTTPQGEKIDQIFDSYYRPLPQICMVGKPKACVGAECTASSTPALDPDGGQ